MGRVGKLCVIWLFLLSTLAFGDQGNGRLEEGAELVLNDAGDQERIGIEGKEVKPAFRKLAQKKKRDFGKFMFIIYGALAGATCVWLALQTVASSKDFSDPTLVFVEDVVSIECKNLAGYEVTKHWEVHKSEEDIQHKYQKVQMWDFQIKIKNPDPDFYPTIFGEQVHEGFPVEDEMLELIESTGQKQELLGSEFAYIRGTQDNKEMIESFLKAKAEGQKVPLALHTYVRYERPGWLTEGRHSQGYRRFEDSETVDAAGDSLVTILDPIEKRKSVADVQMEDPYAISSDESEVAVKAIDPEEEKKKARKREAEKKKDEEEEEEQMGEKKKKKKKKGDDDDDDDEDDEKPKTAEEMEEMVDPRYSGWQIQAMGTKQVCDYILVDRHAWMNPFWMLVFSTVRWIVQLIHIIINFGQYHGKTYWFEYFWAVHLVLFSTILIVDVVGTMVWRGQLLQEEHDVVTKKYPKFADVLADYKKK